MSLLCRSLGMFLSVVFECVCINGCFWLVAYCGGISTMPPKWHPQFSRKAQIVQSVFVGHSSCPLPWPTQVPSLPLPQKIFGVLSFLLTYFLSFYGLFASSFFNIALMFKGHIIAKPKCYPTIYGNWKSS